MQKGEYIVGVVLFLFRFLGFIGIIIIAAIFIFGLFGFFNYLEKFTSKIHPAIIVLLFIICIFAAALQL